MDHRNFVHPDAAPAPCLNMLSARRRLRVHTYMYIYIYVAEASAAGEPAAEEAAASAPKAKKAKSAEEDAELPHNPGNIFGGRYCPATDPGKTRWICAKNAWDATLVQIKG